MGMRRDIEKIRADGSLSAEERVWKAIVHIAETLDEDDDLDLLERFLVDD